ncbi:DUF3667 domain-containing protein [Pontixanthobacter sp.]|uniref:DUF3667 domain-containing protein n=1 Tax=Pontixanthobacter sp. TaxID=2792078 RepID=UPI003C79999C
MSGDGIEAAGQIAEGAIAARAAERAHGQRGNPPASKGHFDERDCLNCGTALDGNYCRHCGQKAHLHRTLAAFGHDLMHGVLHLDGKLWRTLPLLFFKPGEITRRYIEGERAKFVSPMAMFLFSVFVMFAVFQAVGLTTPATLQTPGEVQTALDQPLIDAKQKRDEAQAALRTVSAGNPERASAEAALLEAEEELAAIEAAAEIVTKGSDGQIKFSGTGIRSFDEGLIRKWRDNPGLMLYKLQNNSYKFSWILIPLSVPFVWLLFFWKRQFTVYDHAIFVTYSLAFISLLFIIVSVLGKIGVWAPALVCAAILIPPIHIYKQLRYGYSLSRSGALWRTFTLTNLIAFVVIVLFLWLLLLLGAF